MISAFGVDHGYDEEIEKAFSVGGLGGGIARRVTQLGGAASRQGAGMRRGAATLNPGSTPSKVKMAGGKALGRVGGGLRRLGGGMAARPGLTGGIAAGGAGAGVGLGAGAAFGNRKRF
jgi:hypothetical protein